MGVCARMCVDFVQPQAPFFYTARLFLQERWTPHDGPGVDTTP